MKLFEKIFGKSHETRVSESRQRAKELNAIIEQNQSKRKSTYEPVQGPKVDILILDPAKHGFRKSDGFDRVTAAAETPNGYIVQTSKGNIELSHSDVVTKQEALNDRVWFKVAKPHSHNQGSTHLLADVQFPITEREWPADFNSRPENHYNGVIRH